MPVRVLRNFSGLVQRLIGSQSTPLSEIDRVIVRLPFIQRWFQYHQGRAMVMRHCHARTCGRERMYTIWSDGNYHCLFCLFLQARRHMHGPINLETTQEMESEFTQMWLSYRRCCQGLEEVAPEDGWILQDQLTQKEILAAPPSLCRAEDCSVCKTCRPHVQGAGGVKRCFYCLMKEGLKAVAAMHPKRKTQERLEEAARLAVTTIRSVI